MKNLLIVIGLIISFLTEAQSYDEVFSNTFMDNHELFIGKGYKYLEMSRSQYEITVPYTVMAGDHFLTFGIVYSLDEKVKSLFILSTMNDAYNSYFKFCNENGTKRYDPDFDYLFYYESKLFYFKIKQEQDGVVYSVWITND